MKKIPDNAKKVFEGIIFDVYHWEQEMFDGTTSTFEIVKRIGSVTTLAVVDNKIVVNIEEQPTESSFLTLPGGRIDRGESAIDSAKRELMEETGLESDDWVNWFEIDASDMIKIEWLTSYFIAKNCKKTSEVRFDKGEKIETKYITLEELIEMRHDLRNRISGLKDVLEKAANSEEEKQKLKELLGITT